jgi:D-alanyl-D-alanine carboxypeptidase
VALFGARGLAFEPGARQAYSNYGFILLGRIVEEASGLVYDDYIQRRIFAPAGMTSTGNAPERERLPRRAVGYMGFGPDVRSAADTLPLKGTPAGGGYSTVGDLLRFAEALTANRLLDAEHTRLLTGGGATLGNGTFYRYDFSGALSDGRRYVGHSGGAPGMNGELRIFPDSAYVVAVLSNRDPPLASAVANFVSQRIP